MSSTVLRRVRRTLRRGALGVCVGLFLIALLCLAKEQFVLASTHKQKILSSSQARSFELFEHSGECFDSQKKLRRLFAESVLRGWLSLRSQL